MYRRALIQIFSVVLLSFAASAQTESRATLAQLDHILAKAHSTEEFLAQPALVDEYYKALSSYMGESRVSREQYDAVLKQVRTEVQRIPGLGARLWETTGTGPKTSIQSSIRTSGRTLDARLFSAELSRELKAAGHGAAALTEGEPAAQEAKVKETVALVTEEEKQLKQVPQGMSDKEFGKVKAQKYKELRGSPDVKSLANYFKREILNSEQVKDLFNSRDPDLVIDTLRELRENPRAFLPAGEVIPDAVVSELKSILPDQRVLLANKNMFPQAMRTLRSGKSVPIEGGAQTVYDIVPVPRRFHGVFKGVPIGECVGGNCNTLHALSTERTLTVALKDSWLQFVEHDGTFTGFVEAVPGQVGDKVYSSVSFGSPELRKKVFVTNAATGQRRATTLFDLWAENAQKEKPASWSGFVVSENSTDINNAGVLDTVRKSGRFQWSNSVDERFEHLDPMATQITARAAKTDHSNAYGGKMILDATTPQARNKKLVVLADYDGSTDEIEQFKRFLARSDSPQAKARAVRSLTTEQRVKFADILLGLVDESAPEIRAAAVSSVLIGANDTTVAKLLTAKHPDVVRATVDTLSIEQALVHKKELMGFIAGGDAELKKAVGRSLGHERGLLESLLATQDPDVIKGVLQNGVPSDASVQALYKAAVERANPELKKRLVVALISERSFVNTEPLYVVEQLQKYPDIQNLLHHQIRVDSTVLGKFYADHPGIPLEDHMLEYLRYRESRSSAFDVNFVHLLPYDEDVAARASFIEKFSDRIRNAKDPEQLRTLLSLRPMGSESMLARMQPVVAEYIAKRIEASGGTLSRAQIEEIAGAMPTSYEATKPMDFNKIPKNVRDLLLDQDPEIRKNARAIFYYFDKRVGRSDVGPWFDLLAKKDYAKFFSEAEAVFAKENVGASVRDASQSSSRFDQGNNLRSVLKAIDIRDPEFTKEFIKYIERSGQSGLVRDYFAGHNPVSEAKQWDQFVRKVQLRSTFDVTDAFSEEQPRFSRNSKMTYPIEHGLENDQVMGPILSKRPSLEKVVNAVTKTVKGAAAVGGSGKNCVVNALKGLLQEKP